MFSITLGYCSDPSNRIDKTMTNTITLNGNLRNESEVRNPTILVEGNEFTYNYAYIPAFGRYYYIDDIKSVRNNLYELKMKTDVLMTFQDYILNNEVIVERSGELSDANLYINDGTLVTEDKIVTKVHEFAGSFDTQGEFILITAGG